MTHPAERILREYSREEDRKRKELECAAGLDADASFLEIDWRKFDDFPALSIQTLAALSVGINPDHKCARIEWAEKWADLAADKASGLLKMMVARFGSIERNLDFMGGSIVTVNRHEPVELSTVRLDSFVKYAMQKKLKLPKELSGSKGAAKKNEEQVDRNQHIRFIAGLQREFPKSTARELRKKVIEKVTNGKKTPFEMFEADLVLAGTKRYIADGTWADWFTQAKKYPE